MMTTRKLFPLQSKAVGDRQIETTASTGALDREFDRILASAWQLDHYRKSPVVLWQHSRDLPPIAKSLDVRVVGNALRTVDQFPERGVFPLADQIYDLVQGGFITSKSVGFRPVAWQPNAEGGRNYTEVELLEHSYVSLPANVEAVVTAKSQGVRDPAALDRFFRTPRADDGLVSFEVADLRAALQMAVAQQRVDLEARVRREVTRQASTALFGYPAPAPVLLVKDEHGAVHEIEADLLRAAIGTALQRTVTQKVRTAINALTGRVD